MLDEWIWGPVIQLDVLHLSNKIHEVIITIPSIRSDIWVYEVHFRSSNNVLESGQTQTQVCNSN